MKVLLDECVDARLAREIIGHEGAPTDSGVLGGWGLVRETPDRVPGRKTGVSRTRPQPPRDPMPESVGAPGHEVHTVHRMGWAGLDDGAVLRLAESSLFEAVVTTDRNLEFQQNLATFRLAIVVLNGGTRLADHKRLVPDLLAALPKAQIGAATRVGP